MLVAQLKYKKKEGKIKSYKKGTNNCITICYSLYLPMQGHQEIRPKIFYQVSLENLVLGTLINFVNMKKINSRGVKQANKHVLMAALTYNLKKYLKYTYPKVVSSCQMMDILEKNSQNLVIKLFLAFSKKVNFKLLFHL